MLFLVVCALVVSAQANNDEEPFGKLSQLLKKDFSCDRCWAPDNPNSPETSTTAWCLCCFFNCGGNRAACMRDNAFCQHPLRCQEMQVCTEWGGIAPDGAKAGKPDTFCEGDKRTLKRSPGSPNKPKVELVRTTALSSVEPPSPPPPPRIEQDWNCPDDMVAELIDFNSVVVKEKCTDKDRCPLSKFAIPEVFSDAVKSVWVWSQCHGGKIAVNKQLDNVWLYDSNQPDLPGFATPNKNCGDGPGIGACGASDGDEPNCHKLNNVLYVGANKAGTPCAKSTDLGILFKDPVIVRLFAILNQTRVDNPKDMRDVPKLIGLDGTTHVFENTIVSDCDQRTQNGLTVQRYDDSTDFVKEIKLWYAEPIAVAYIGICRKPRDPEKCDLEWTQCPLTGQESVQCNKCECVDAEDNGIHRCKGSAILCDKQQSASNPCVCANDPTVECVPPKTSPPETSCETSAECFAAFGCDVVCWGNVCVDHKDNPLACAPKSGVCGVLDDCKNGECLYEASDRECNTPANECMQAVCTAEFTCAESPVAGGSCTGVDSCEGTCADGECVCNQDECTNDADCLTLFDVSCGYSCDSGECKNDDNFRACKNDNECGTVTCKSNECDYSPDGGVPCLDSPCRPKSCALIALDILECQDSLPFPTGTPCNGTMACHGECAAGACICLTGACCKKTACEDNVAPGDCIDSDEQTFFSNQTCADACFLTPPCVEVARCGERPGCYGGLRDGLVCRTKAECPGGDRCVPLEEACANDAPCQDCDEAVMDGMRAHNCGPCAFCDSPEAEYGALGLPCCPFAEYKRYTAILNSAGAPTVQSLPEPVTNITADPNKKAWAFVQLEVRPDTKEFCLNITAKNVPASVKIGEILPLDQGYDFSLRTTWLDTSVPFGQCYVTLGENQFEMLEALLADGKLGYGLLYELDLPDDPFAIGGLFEPIQEGPTKPIRRKTSSKCHPTEELDSQGSCSPRLGCSCQNCDDMCDFDLKESTELGYAWSGFTAGEFSDLCDTLPANNVSSTTCEALSDVSCRLRSSSPIRAILEPHAVGADMTAFCATRETHARKQFDTYLIYAPERQLTVTVRNTRVNLTNAGFRSMYLINANDWCSCPDIIAPDSFITNATPPDVTTYQFTLPRPGDYIIVFSLLEPNDFFNNQFLSALTEEERRALRCFDYEISFTAQAPTCPSEICDLTAYCHGARDCTSPSCYACATQYGRCILSPPFQDRLLADPARQYENRLQSSEFHLGWQKDDTPEADDWWALWQADKEEADAKRPKSHDARRGPGVCWGAETDTPCIGTLFNNVTNKHECYKGACRGEGFENCELPIELTTFDCGCKCAAVCTSDLECADGNPFTVDKCDRETGVCVVREIETLWQCEPYVDIQLSQQPILAGCESETLAVHGTCEKSPKDANETTCFYTANDEGSSSINPVLVVRNCTVSGRCRSDKTCTCHGVQELPVCTRTVDGKKSVHTCTDNSPPTTPVPTLAPVPAGRTVLAHERTYEVSSASTVEVECAAQALDAAELAHTAAAFDVYGTYVGNSRLGPICSISAEERAIDVNSDAHASALPECCSSIDVEHACLDGAHTQTALGRQWLDRAWRRLDEATRLAQHRSARESLVASCCASLYYSALADWCGRKGANADYWSLAGSTVHRAADGVGPECAAFDDGHRDRDLNDWVVEQRVVEIRSADDTLRAINVHVKPLARGGGYKASYALSLRGTQISSIDHGANAACSSRARALLHSVYDSAAVAQALADRTELPDGTLVSVLHHADGEAALPHGVHDSSCVTLTTSSIGPVYCPAQIAGDVALFDDVTLALPPSQPDGIDALLGVEVPTDRSTNTQRGTRTVHAQYTASAVISVPQSSASAHDLRFVLRNEDCGAAVLLPTKDAPEPLAVRVPPHSCAAFRWSAEGVQLVQEPDSSARVCRGGELGGISECSSDATCSFGQCAGAPAQAGVPYTTAYAHFACGACVGDADCARPECVNSACCSEQTIHWYRYPTAALVYQPQHGLNMEDLLSAPSALGNGRAQAPKKSGSSSSSSSSENDWSSSSSSDSRSDSKSDSKGKRIDAQVIIGGAGYAAIAAAERLAGKGISFLIVEATELMGGRMKSLPFGEDENGNAYNIAVGANWVQGRAGNPVEFESQKYGLRGNPQNFDDALIYDENGALDEDETNYEEGTNCARADEAYVGAGRISRRCLQPSTADSPIANNDRRFCQGLNARNVAIGFGADFEDLDDRSNTEGETGWTNRFFVPSEARPPMARLCQYYSQDYEWAEAPNVTSLNNTLPINTYNDFEDADYWVGGKRSRGYEWLVKSKAAEFITPSKKTNRVIEFVDVPEIQFMTKILEVRWSNKKKDNERVDIVVCTTERVSTSNGLVLYPCVKGSERTLRAENFISTFAVGVLRKTLAEERARRPTPKSKDVAPRFNPPLTSVPALAAGLDRYPMGYYSKIFFQFANKFWDESQFVLSAYSQGRWQGEFAPVWQSLDIDARPRRFLSGSKIFFVTVTGERALELQQPGVTDTQIIAEMLPVLNQMYATQITSAYGRLLEEQDVLHFEMERWIQNPLFRGMYSNMRANATWQALEPTRARYNNILFSGEHTCFRYNGYVHGALLAGERSARILLQERYGFADEFKKSICDLAPIGLDADGVATADERYVVPEPIAAGARVAPQAAALDDDAEPVRTGYAGPNGPNYVVHSRGFKRPKTRYDDNESLDRQ